MDVGPVARKTCVPRTVSLAIEIGKAIREARSAGKEDVCDALVGYFKSSTPPRFASVLFDGKVQDILRETTAGFAVGKVRFEALGEPRLEMTITFQNEYSHASIDGKTLAIVPDLIAIQDRETGQPITTENLGYGQQVKILAIAATENMRSEQALDVIGPRAFGINEDFQSLEALAWS